MIKSFFRNNKLLFCVAIVVTAFFVSSFCPSGCKYDWKMNVKWGLAKHIQNGFARFGTPGTWPLCKEKDSVVRPWTTAYTLANNPAGVLASTASFSSYDREGESIMNINVSWTADDLHKAVKDSCLYTGYGNPTYPYKDAHFCVEYAAVAVPGQPRPAILPGKKWGVMLRFSNEIRITGTTGIGGGNGNIDVKLYPIDNGGILNVEEL